MAVGFGKEFHASRVVKFLEEVEDFGRIVFEKFERSTAEADGTFEESSVGLCHFDEGLKCGDVALLGRFGDGALVLVVIVVVVVGTDVEEAIALEMYILVNLEVQTNCLHIVYFL